MEASIAAKISSGSRTRQGRADQARRYAGEITVGSKADPGKPRIGPGHVKHIDASHHFEKLASHTGW